MYSLILETSSEKSLFAIAQEETIIYKKDLILGVRDSTEIVPIIEMGLNQCDLGVDKIDMIILGSGPGSFTGLRIGASVAKAFAYAHSIPIIPVKSLQTLSPPKSYEGTFAVLMDAKAQGVYLQKGLKEGSQVYFDDQVQKIKVDQLDEALSNTPLLISTQKKSLVSKLPESICSKLEEAAPDPEMMVKIALKRPKTTLVRAQDELHLEYFSTPS